MNEKNIEVSAVVPISERHDDIAQVYHLYADELIKIGRTFEFIFIVDGEFPVAYNDLQKLKNEGKPIKVIKFAKKFGESTALLEGFRHAKGEIILTLASYIQIEPSDLARIFNEYDRGYDLVITRRFPRKDPVVNQMQSRIYHYIIRKLTGTAFNDITSGARLINRKVLSEFVLYGDLHRFIPIFAQQKGLKVKEVKVAQRREDTKSRLVSPGIYLRRVLDILTLFFLVKFTKKPLRFFGLIGSGCCIIGFIISLYLTVLKLIGSISLSNRPLLILGILLMVFGIQIFAVGLVGELILFNHARDIKDYSIEEIID